MDKVYLSNIRFKKKPNSYEIKKISSTILKDIFEFNNIKEFAEELTIHGRSVILAQFSVEILSKNSPIRSQTMVMLDFDNNDPNNQYTLEDLKTDEWMLNNACFYYRTFSDKNSEVDKFRVVIRLEKSCKNTFQVERIYKQLFKKYPQSDTSVGQTNRIFYGSNQGYEEINFDNTLDMDNLLEENLNMEVSLYEEHSIIDENTPNYLLFKYKKYEILKEKFGNNYSLEFADNISARNYFSEIDIKELLELPEGNPFLDILHEEKNPSASVFLDEKVDTWYYHVFSDTRKFTGDIFRVLVELMGLPDTNEGLQILISVTNCSLKLDSQLHKEKENSELFRKDLLSGKLYTEAPELFKLLDKYKYEINALLDTFYDYTYTDKYTGEVRFLNFISKTKLTQIVNYKLKNKISVNKLNTVVNLLVTVEIINKLSTEKIPKDIITDIIEKQQSSRHNYRTSNVIETSDLEDVYINNYNDVAKKLLESKLPIYNLNFESIYRLFGETKANEVFPQSIIPIKENSKKYFDKSDKNITKVSITFEKHCVDIIQDNLNNNGYIFEDILVRKLSRKTKKTLKSTQATYNKMRADIMSKYGLTRERNTKRNHVKYNIEDKFTSKIIIYKKDNS